MTDFATFSGDVGDFERFGERQRKPEVLQLCKLGNDITQWLLATFSTASSYFPYWGVRMATVGYLLLKYQHELQMYHLCNEISQHLWSKWVQKSEHIIRLHWLFLQHHHEVEICHFDWNLSLIKTLCCGFWCPGSAASPHLVLEGILPSCGLLRSPFITHQRVNVSGVEVEAAGRSCETALPPN